MPIKNTASVYGSVAIALHWVSALCIFGLFALGLWMTSLDYYHPWYKQGPDLHRSIGFVLVLATLGRLCWRWANPKPTPEPAPLWQQRLAGAIHGLFYGFIICLFISGYLITTAKGQTLDVFGFFSLPALITSDKNLEDWAGEVHEILAFVLIGLALLHGLAAVKHHLIDKDSTLLRMLGKTKQPK
jgi:cytochrome b561